MKICSFQMLKNYFYNPENEFIFKEAEKMFEEEIKDSYSSGRFDYEDYVKGIKLKVKQSQEYFEQYYKNEKS